MDDVLQTLKPSSAETTHLTRTTKHFLKQLGTNALVGGSFAKGTWLSGDHDIDVFVPYSKQAKNIAEQLGKTLTKKFKKVTRVHGSRDYYQLTYDDVTFEVVPIKKITKAADAENITDVSPLHVQWVNRNTTPFLKDQIRLAKQFCKAHHIYGAETHIKGFSGYVLEILTINYGNFAKLLKHALHWKEGMIIDTAGHYTLINASKRSALIVIDPVQPDRNAAAALSTASVQTFKDAARAFLRHPSPDAFVIKQLTLNDLKKHDLVITVTPRKGKRDVVGAQLLKAYEYLADRLTREGYTITEKGWQWDEKTAYYWYSATKKALSKTITHYGPPITNTTHAAVFRKKYAKRKPRIVHGRLVVTLPRKHLTLRAYAASLLKQPDFQNRIKAAKIIS